MAGSLNRATIIGHLGSDPEVKTLQSGGKVANFSVATSESWTDKSSGEKKEKTEWHRIVIWNESLVGIAQKYLKKGSKVLLEGQLQTRKWQDQSGADKYTTEIVLNVFGSQLILLDGKPQGQESAQQEQASKSNSRPASAAPKQQSLVDDDIPF